MTTRSVGMTRRELEREINWLLRSPPDDPRALAKAFASALVTLIDKNNQRLAETLGHSTSQDVQEDY
jgi:hypothetical protein